MQPQYSYEPPRYNLLARLKEPPLSYILLGVGLLVIFYLFYAWPKYGVEYGARVFILLIAMPVHELAHAVTAYRLGDSTPKYDGRLTLNPLAHLDLFGSLLILVAGLGWAKPVRFNPYALRTEPRFGAMIVAIAGPASNLVLAIVLAMVWHAVMPFWQGLRLPLLGQIGSIWVQFALINVALCFFNLIPLAPLDGFTVLRGLLPISLVYQLDRIRPYSFLIFMLIFLVGGSIVGWLIWTPSYAITRLLFGL